MSAHRALAAAALIGSAPVLLLTVGAGPAWAHGAPTDPVSRVAACGREGGTAGSAACVAAARASGGGAAFKEWDNLRVPNVAGRDRRMIPDGKLCSAGIDAYEGLDLPRADWPADRLRAGKPFNLTYASTIPHKGTFSVYLTKAGYDPRQPLTWGDLDAKPFLTAKDPALRDGAYRLRGELPAGRTGRHLMYTVWRNTDTPDTYYSCSDVVLTGGKPASGAGSASGGGAGSGKEKATEDRPEKRKEQRREKADGQAERSTAGQPSESPAPSGSGPAAQPASAAGDSDGVPVLPIAVAAAAALAAAGAAGAYHRRRRSSR
ncbi:lytic polysaccharide monooxygenase [Streptomyces sp. NPDC047108]|uniref:lytic polysaccharide monooxygenase auxiliary activity family 9 protein n=1 Tax=Streptomyces sp. NPDC047108 TaxID=3155025 RepID=UPI0033E58444